MRLKSDKQKYFIYWVISVSILLILLWVFQIRIDRKIKDFLSRKSICRIRVMNYSDYGIIYVTNKID